MGFRGGTDVVTIEELMARRDEIAQSPDLAALLARQIERAEPVLRTMPPVPQVKALLSADGGVCPADGAVLLFDPWSPERHRCPQCGQVYTGERHHGHWARAQHLWIAERAAHLATVGVLAEHEPAIRRARELLMAYRELYFQLPNRDNVLGPTHLFFSTYLESMWILNFFLAAHLLRESGQLPEDEEEVLHTIGEESAFLIGEFNEGMSNRQTWNSAALTALSVWFGDEELAQTAIEGRTGLLGHLADGFGDDGMWYEGENYHLFALRGLLIGMGWARLAGVNLIPDDRSATHLARALLAPAWSALPDLTFPARKDSRYGVSLAHPAYLESWENGWAVLGDRAPDELAAWLQALYPVPVTPAQTYDAYLHEAGETVRSPRTRADLSSWALLTMAPSLPDEVEPWTPPSIYLPGQGLAVLRAGSRYVSLECGATGGGHGHPDRLHLTVHADGVHWLADPGAGSYVSRDLFWYRSTVAHNAPRLDGHSQPAGSAVCRAFEADESWGWTVGAFGDATRTVIAGPEWIYDRLAVESEESRLVELPWHLAGDSTVETPGSWTPVAFDDEFIRNAAQFTPAAPGPVVIRSTEGSASVRLWLDGGDLIRAECPGLPGRSEWRPIYLLRRQGKAVHFTALLDLAGGVTAFTPDRAGAAVTDAHGVWQVQSTLESATVKGPTLTITLGGAIPAPRTHRRVMADRPLTITGQALHVVTPPLLDGTPEGFDTGAPLVLDAEHQYLRSELPYSGPDEFSAVGYVNWDEDAVYLAVEVTKPDLVIRAPDASPLGLDNEPDDIHADGVQAYLRVGDGPVSGYLLRPGPGSELQVRPLTLEAPSIQGQWQRTDSGYSLTALIPVPGLSHLPAGADIGFDLVINEMHSDRIRRAGQLIWSGGDGWVYLRGDRHDPSNFGTLELVG